MFSCAKLGQNFDLQWPDVEAFVEYINSVVPLENKVIDVDKLFDEFSIVKTILTNLRDDFRKRRN